MTKLSVNINKVALIRNSREGNFPDILKFAKDCESYGAEGITVHPRPDERHIRYGDIEPLKKLVTTEFNIEGNPNRKFLDLVLKNKPHQCTLVPDSPDALTSDSGWDTIQHKAFLMDTIAELHDAGIRVSIFLDAEKRFVEGAKEVGADRIELYTGEYAKLYSRDREVAIKSHVETAKYANKLGIGVNAGHDLNLENLAYYKKEIPMLAEVSIGHAIWVDSLYFGIANVIPMYKKLLK